MRLFPTVHATGDLPPAHRAHLELHGLVFVAADDDPDLVLVLPGHGTRRRRHAAPAWSCSRRAPRRRRSRGLLASRGITVHAAAAPAERARPRRPHRRRPPRVDHRRGAARARDPRRRRVPPRRSCAPPRAARRSASPWAPGCATSTAGCSCSASTRSPRPEVLLNAAIWAARPRRCGRRRRPPRRARVAPGVDPAEAGRHRAPGPAGQGRVRPGRRSSTPAPASWCTRSSGPSTSSRPRCRTTRTT